MKSLLLAAALLAALPALAQTPAPPSKLFSSQADVQALIAQARKDQKSPDTNTVEYIAVHAPYKVQLELRTGTTPPTLHPKESELVEVIDGGATLMTGGTLTGIKPGNPGASTLSGTGIEGATPQKIAKGDYVLIPANTPHQFQAVQGQLIIMSVHLPMPDAK